MIQALTKLDPIQQYYVNDHYLHSISARDIKTNQSYSPKVLIQGYWKKDYQTFLMLNQSNEDQSKFNLPQINTKSIQQSFVRLEEAQSNERYLGREFNLKQYKIRPSCNNSCTIRKQREQYKLPGRLIKGSFPHNKNIQQRENQKCNDNLSIEHLDIKPALSPKLLFQSSPPSNSSFDNQLSSHKVTASPIKKTLKTSVYKPLSPMRQEIKIRKQHINSITLQSNFVKLTNTSISNVILIQFDELLGFNENSYYGLQSDFTQSELYKDYSNTKEHYFQRINNHSSMYVLKNLKEMFLSLSKLYQIVLLTSNSCQAMIDFVNERKMPVSMIYQFKPSEQTQLRIRALECHQVFADLQIKKPSKIILIQAYEAIQHQEAPHINTDYFIIEQNIIFPYADEIPSENFHLLIFPSLSMNNIIKSQENQSNKTFLHALYFIEQFAQQMLLDCPLNIGYNIMQKLNGNTIFQEKQEKINFQIEQIEQIKQAPLIQQTKYSKKEMASRIAENFESTLNIKELSQELVIRNKRIIKRIMKYKQESINLLQNVKDQFEKEKELITYCQTLLNNCFYIQF